MSGATLHSQIRLHDVVFS